MRFERGDPSVIGRDVSHTEPHTRRGRKIVTLGVLATSVLSFALIQSLVIPALTLIERFYGTSETTATWVVTAYLLAASVATPLLGRLGDCIGKKRVLVATLILLATGSLIGAFAPTIQWLIAGRTIQGMGGGVIPLAFGISRDNFGRRLPSALALLTSMTSTGFGLGVVVAGPITDLLGYRWLYLIPMFASLLAALASALAVPQDCSRRRLRLPVRPAILLSIWLLCILLAITEGNVYGWLSAPIATLSTAAVIGCALWARSESRASTPLIDLALARRRGIWTANTITACVGFGTFAFFAFLPRFMQTPAAAGYGFAASLSSAGHVLVPYAVTSAAASLATARLLRYFGPRAVIACGSIIMSAAFCSLALLHSDQWQAYFGSGAVGLGCGLVLASLAGVVLRAAPTTQVGVASGMNANIKTIGGALGSAVFGAIVSTHAGSLGITTERGYQVGFLALAVGMLPAVVASFAVPT